MNNSNDNILTASDIAQDKKSAFGVLGRGARLKRKLHSPK